MALRGQTVAQSAERSTIERDLFNVLDRQQRADTAEAALADQAAIDKLRDRAHAAGIGWLALYAVVEVKVAAVTSRFGTDGEGA